MAQLLQYVLCIYSSGVKNMKGLRDDLKRMLAGLAYQNAGEFLPIRDKIKVLGYGPEPRDRAVTSPKRVLNRPSAIKRIAFISNGRGLGAPLDYAIDACLRQNAQIDLLFHGAIDTESISVLERRVQQAGLDHQSIKLGNKAVDSILNYIDNRTSLLFLVAMPGDKVAKTLIEEVIPKRRERIHVPLVLIEEHKSNETHKRSAA
jgi:hypothetical protein